MTTNFKAIIIADSHIGADKFDTHPDRWDAPVRQAFNYAVESKADVVISCGDFMHKRNPTVAELLRRQKLLSSGISFVEVDGNHDRANAEGSRSALEVHQSHVLFQGGIHQVMFSNGPRASTVNLIGLPWPRPVDYLNDEAMKLGIDRKIEVTRQLILNKLKDLVEQPDTSRLPTILFGHCMLAYGQGHDDPKDPGLILGKDVVLPYQSFIDAGLTENQIFMGHVHDPSALGYVGSTQPTDWGDAEHDKSFIELNIKKNNVFPDTWGYFVTRHSYADQLRLHDIVVDSNVHIKDLIHSVEQIDVARVTINLKPGDDPPNEAAIREAIEDRPNYKRCDRVIINHPEREAARVETATPLADMPEDEAFETWMRQSGFTAEQAVGPHGIFQELVESST